MTKHYIFDGFMHRPFEEDRDGWRNEIPSEFEYPAVKQANEILVMFDEICRLRKENWELKQKVSKYHELLDSFAKRL